MISVLCCEIIWYFRQSLRRNFLEQKSQTCCGSSKWILMWAFKLSFRVKFLPHTGHWSSLNGSWIAKVVILEWELLLWFLLEGLELLKNSEIEIKQLIERNQMITCNFIFFFNSLTTPFVNTINCITK